MDTTQTAQFQVGDLVRHKVSQRTARIEEYGVMDKWEYVSLYMHRKLVSSHHRALALAELEAEWEYAKPRPNPARKQLAALKAAAREYITYNGGDGDDITCRISIGRLVKLAKLLGVDPLIEGGV